MRAIALGCIALALSTTASAGPIADQFAAGVGGVSWGMTLDELLGIRPGGEQFFSTAPGERGYAVADDAPLYGVPRPEMRTQYHLGKDNRATAIAFGVPYERREQLLAELLLLFGQYQKPVVSGTALVYRWPVDGRLGVSVRASREPKNGILEFWVMVKERREAE